MTPENKGELIEASAEKLQMQICWNQTDNCNKSVVCNKINTQSQDKLNKTMAKCVMQHLGHQDAGIKRLLVSPNLFGQHVISYLVSNANKRGRTGKTQNKCTINKMYYTPWKHFCLLFLLLLSNWTNVVYSASTEPSGIQIDPDDGGYTGIVFEIKEEVPEESCAEILKNVKVRTILLYLYIYIERIKKI